MATLFAQFVGGYTGRSPEYRGRGDGQQAVWSLAELQELLDEWIIAAWQNRPHDGLRDPLHPGRAFTPNEKYAAMAEAAGYVPVALTAEDYVELLPARWHAVNAYGVKVNRRTYDGEELNPFRQQPSGVKDHKDLWQVDCDPYDISRIWVRDHWNGGWVTVFWTQLDRVAAPFGEIGLGPRPHLPAGSHRGPSRRRRSTACSAGRHRARWREPGKAGPPQPTRRGPDQGSAKAPRIPGQSPARRERGTGRETRWRGACRGDPDADLRSLRRGGQAVVTRQPGPGDDPRLRALTSLAGWRQFASEVPAVPQLLDTGVWQDLDPGKRGHLRR